MLDENLLFTMAIGNTNVHDYLPKGPSVCPADMFRSDAFLNEYLNGFSLSSSFNLGHAVF